MQSPKIRLVYYKNIVEECFACFFDDCENCFAKDPFGRYVLTDFSVLDRYLKKQVIVILSKYVKKFDILKPEYTFVIGGCAPSENMLLDYRTKYFPKKLSDALEAGCPRYVMKERDIIIDMHKFDETVNAFFSNVFLCGFEKILGTGYENVFAIKHRRLDCYSIFKALKYIYGRSNCINVWKDEMKYHKRCLTAVNDLIDLYVNNKVEMNKSQEFKMIVKELKQYADGCLKGIRNGG